MEPPQKMRSKRSASRSYFSAPPSGQGQPVNQAPGLSPFARNMALGCTALAMLAVGGVLGGVAWYAQQVEPEGQKLAAAVKSEAAGSETGAVATAAEIKPADTGQSVDGASAVEKAQPAAAESPAPAVPAVATSAAPSKEVVIGQNDARWARDVAPAAAAHSMGLADAATARAYTDRTQSPAWQALRDVVAKTEGPDSDEAADASKSRASIEEAGGTAEQEKAGEDVVETAAIDPTPEPEQVRPEVTAAAPSGTGRISKAANIRSAARKGAAVLGTVPTNASVQVVSCDIWCEIVYEGKRGFVYKDFVSRGAAKPAVPTAAEEEPTAKAEAQPTAVPGLPKPIDTNPSAANMLMDGDRSR